MSNDSLQISHRLAPPNFRISTARSREQMDRPHEDGCDGTIRIGYYHAIRTASDAPRNRRGWFLVHEGDMLLSVLQVGAAALLVLADPTSVSRAAPDDVATCANARGDQSIAACSRAISSGGLHGEELAVAYKNQGVEYNAKGDYDRAIADYDQAVQLDPKYAVARQQPGQCVLQQGRL